MEASGVFSQCKRPGNRVSEVSVERDRFAAVSSDEGVSFHGEFTEALEFSPCRLASAFARFYYAADLKAAGILAQPDSCYQ